MSGVELAQYAKRQFPDLNVVMVSGHRPPYVPHDTHWRMVEIPHEEEKHATHVRINADHCAKPRAAIAPAIAIVAAFFTTLDRIDTRTASKEAPPGTTGLAKPR
jgi:hypothetical protein